MISAGFAVGIGGTLFAIEHEERTIALLRRLPVRAFLAGLAGRPAQGRTGRSPAPRPVLD